MTGDNALSAAAIGAMAKDARAGTVYVSTLVELAEHARAIRPGRLVSLVPPYEQPPTPQGLAPECHLRLELDDIDAPLPGHILPELQHIVDLIAFVQDWDGVSPFLVHCAKGISRSMAAAFVAIAIKSGGDERTVARHIRDQAAHAKPNRRIVALADRLLQRDGRLVSALEAMGPAVPVESGRLVRFTVPSPLW